MKSMSQGKEENEKGKGKEEREKEKLIKENLW